MNRETAREKFKLSQEQKSKLFARYYAGEAVKNLIKDFKLYGLQTSQIIYLFDNIKTDIKCEHCKTIMEKEPNARKSNEKDIFEKNIDYQA